ncbi:hypothetical protein ACFL2H_13345 [Planctomycetota bacterium]
MSDDRRSRITPAPTKQFRLSIVLAWVGSFAFAFGLIRYSLSFGHPMWWSFQIGLFLIGLFLIGANVGAPPGLIIAGRTGALWGSILGGIVAHAIFFIYVMWLMANMSPKN